MEALNHTPGDWYIQFMNRDDEESDFWVKSDENPVVHYGTDIMAEDYGEHNGYPREQRLADAKLIAASPKMYEMIHDCLETLNILLLELPKDDVILRHEVESRKNQITNFLESNF